MNHIYKTVLDMKTGVIKAVSEKTKSSKSKTTKAKVSSKVDNHRRLRTPLIKSDFKKSVLATLIGVVSTVFTTSAMATDPQIHVTQYLGNQSELMTVDRISNVLVSNKDGQILSSNAHVLIQDLDSIKNPELVSPANIYGGYKSGENAGVQNTSVDVLHSQLNNSDIYGAFVNNAYATSTSTGDVKIDGSKVKNVTGAYAYDSAIAAAPIDGTSTSTGNVVIQGSSTVEGSVKGAFTHSIGTATSTGDVVIQGSSTVNKEVIGADARADSNVYEINLSDAAISTGDVKVDASTVKNVIGANTANTTNATSTGDVVIQGNSIVDSVKGASAHSYATATSTGDVVINSSTVNEEVIGAEAEVFSIKSTFTATSTSTGDVKIDGSTVKNVTGAYAYDHADTAASITNTSTSTGNVVIQGNSIVDSVKGASAHSSATATSTGDVVIQGSSTVNKEVIGADAWATSSNSYPNFGDAAISTGDVKVDGSTVKNVIGANTNYTANATSTGDVVIQGNSIVDSVKGAFAYSYATATSTGDVVINSSTVNEKVIGAEARVFSTESTSTPTSTSTGDVVIEGSSTVKNVTGAEAQAETYGLDATATAIGDVRIDASTVEEKVIGATANAYNRNSGATATATATAIGDVVIQGGSSTINEVTGSDANAMVFAYASILPDTATVTTTSTGNVKIDARTVKNVIGANADARFMISSTSTDLSTATATAIGDVVIQGNSIVDSVKGASAFTGATSTTISASSATATGNVVIDGSKVKNVTGAEAHASTAIANGTMTITDSVVQNVVGATVRGSGSEIHLNAQNNIVTLQGEDTRFEIMESAGIGFQTSLFGAQIASDNKESYASYNVFTGNKLNMESAPITVDNLGNFETYNFHINDANSHVVNTDTALITVTNQLKNDSTVNVGEKTQENISKFKITGISGKYEPKTNEKITLLALGSDAKALLGDEKKEKLDALFNNTDEHIVSVGLTKEAKVSYEILDKEIVASFTKGVINNERAEYNLKPLAEGHLASLMNITRTTDLIANNVLSGSEMNDGDYSPFVIFEGGRDRYNSGSHIKSTSYRGVFGGKYKLNDFTLGGFVTYGGGDYDTYNSMDTKEFNGQGNARHYGLGVITKYAPEATNYYIDGSLEFGKSRNRFDSDIITGGGTAASFRSDRNYVSGHIGTGYVYPFNDKNTLDTSFKYLASHIGSDQVMIDGESVNLHSLTSSRLQLKTEWLHQYTPVVGVIGALGYEHEFDAKSGVSVDGYNLADQPSLKGGTGIMEIGLTYNPFKSTTNEFIDFRIKGSTGEREGVSAIINLKYTF